MVYNHSFKNTGDGNFYMAMDGSVPKLHTENEPEPSADQDLVVYIYQDGNDVVYEMRGSLDLSALTPYQSNLRYDVNAGVGTQGSLFWTKNTPYATVIYQNTYQLYQSSALHYTILSTVFTPTSISYQDTGYNIAWGGGRLVVEAGYNGETIQRFLRFANTTLSDMGATAPEGTSLTTYLTDDNNISVGFFFGTPVTPAASAPPTPTPTSTPTNTPTASPTPTPTSTPPSLSLTPTPSPSSQPADFGIHAFTKDGLGYINLDGYSNSISYDGGGYSYSFNSMQSVYGGNLSYNSGLDTWRIYDSFSGLYFNIGPLTNGSGYSWGSGDTSGSAAWYGGKGSVLGSRGPYCFKPILAGTSGLYIIPKDSSGAFLSGRRRIWLLGSGIDGGGTINYTYSYRQVGTTNYYTTNGQFTMDDWCAGSYTNSVSASMSRRNALVGTGQSITTRIYRYGLAQISAGYEISSVYFYDNSNGGNGRILGIAWD